MLEAKENKKTAMIVVCQLILSSPWVVFLKTNYPENIYSYLSSPLSKQIYSLKTTKY